MGVFDFPNCKIITSRSSVDAKGKTLVISCHGWQNGGTFTRPYPAVVQFLCPPNRKLNAELEFVLTGRQAPAVLATGVQVKLEDYDFAWYSGDPHDTVIEGMLSGKSFDVHLSKGVESMTIDPRNKSFDIMVMKKGIPGMSLSSVLTFLKLNGYMYPSIWCLFCRVSAQQYEGGSLPGISFVGTTRATTMAMNTHKVNATAIALELQSQGWKQ